MPGRHHGEIDSDDLYGLPLDRFVTERGALVRTLRGDGRRDEAADVARLRRPSIAAWAVNQLVRTQRGAVEALLDAGDELRDAQADLLAGRGTGRELRAAGERERVAVDRLMDDARGLLTSQGNDLSAVVLERVADTLHAAALDENAREQVRGGRLERELRHVGLGLGEDGAAASSSSSAKGKVEPTKAASTHPEPSQRDREAKSRAGKERVQRDRAAQRRADAERVRHEREAALAASRAAEAAASRRAESATSAVQAAEEHRRHAAQALREADETLAIAREEARTVNAELRRIRADLQDT